MGELVRDIALHCCDVPHIMGHCLNHVRNCYYSLSLRVLQKARSVISWRLEFQLSLMPRFHRFVIVADVNWGSSTQAQCYSIALRYAIDLNGMEEHVKNYRPQILILSGIPGWRPPLVHFASLVTKGLSLLVCGHAVKVCMQCLPFRLDTFFEM